jgi:hypothetical protein
MAEVGDTVTVTLHDKNGMPNDSGLSVIFGSK